MRALVWLIALYLLADVSAAGMPGAFTFSADDSVEVVRAATPKIPTNPLRTAPPEPRMDEVRLTDIPRAPGRAVVVVSAITIATHSPTIRLRTRIRHLSSEDGPAPSPAV